MIPDNVRRRLKKAQHVVFFTGSGMSKESGISTFRDAEGLWAKFNPEEVATPSAFKKNPQFVWDWYVARAENIRKAAPNAGHRAISLLANVVEKVTTITQNVDGLHAAAGSANVIELHGNLLRLRAFIDEDAAFSDGKNPVICPCCNADADPDTLDPYASKEDFERIELIAGNVPRCPGCGALLRPSVVWFNEPLDHQILLNAIEAVDNCDCLICVGSSLEVAPASDFPYRAIRSGAMVIEVNPEPTDLSLIATANLAGSAAKVLPKLLAEVWGISLFPSLKR